MPDVSIYFGIVRFLVLNVVLVVMEAIQYDGSFNDAKVFCPTAYCTDLYNTSFIWIPTLEGDHKCLVGDFIIKGIVGEFYPCRGDIFEKTYEKVEI